MIDNFHNCYEGHCPDYPLIKVINDAIEKRKDMSKAWVEGYRAAINDTGAMYVYEVTPNPYEDND